MARRRKRLARNRAPLPPPAASETAAPTTTNKALLAAAALLELAKWGADHFEESGVYGMGLLGTAEVVRFQQLDGGLPTHNWDSGYFACAHEISGHHMADTILKERDTCYACTVRCKRVVQVTEGSTLITDSPNLQSWNIAGSSGTWRGDESPAGSETVARYQTDIMGTREGQSVLLTGVCGIKPIDGKIVQTTLWESDQFIVPLKRGNARGGKGLAVEPLGQGHIHRTKRRVKDGNKTGLITYPENDREVLLKSRMRENLKFGSVRGVIAASGRRWL